MSNAKLISITIERFKSFKEKTKIPLAPLTVIVGRNNSGKSTLIQSLLLLKQTLNDPRPDVMLKLDGLVEAFNLRELTYGWPAAGERVAGPVFTLEWECEFTGRQAFLARDANLKIKLDISKIRDILKRKKIITYMTINTFEYQSSAYVAEIKLQSSETHNNGENIQVSFRGDPWSFYWGDLKIDKFNIEFDHFIPHVSGIALHYEDEDWFPYNAAFRFFFRDQLESLKKLLSDLDYLGSERLPPPSLFKPATTPPKDIGANGEFAAQLLHRKQNEIVHFLSPFTVSEKGVEVSRQILARPLAEAVNIVLESLSIHTPLRVEEIMQVGFQIMFGNANIVHVGRGLSYLLPLVELGLIADPLRFSGERKDLPLNHYQSMCSSFSHMAMEEPEAHLHPKVASRLAHWLVSLAMANRRLMIETHSDHLVRRLRGLAARAGRGSELEQWLVENVVVLVVDQDEDGCSSVTTSRLTPEGGIAEVWPADFMDESADEESAIYYARLDKEDAGEEGPSPVEMVEEDEPEGDEAP